MARTFTREAFHALVWSQPMTQLGREFGLSDVALHEICRKHAIPVPPRGWWARKTAGQAVAACLPCCARRRRHTPVWSADANASLVRCEVAKASLDRLETLLAGIVAAAARQGFELLAEGPVGRGVQGVGRATPRRTRGGAVGGRPCGKIPPRAAVRR